MRDRPRRRKDRYAPDVLPKLQIPSQWASLATFVGSISSRQHGLHDALFWETLG
jgi:hypothetical protein